MATTAGDLALKGNVFSEANEALYDPYPEFNHAFGDISMNIPWSEWNDADLNNEIWEDKSKTVPNVLFEDGSRPVLPVEIKQRVSSWKRPSEVFPGESLTVYNPNNTKFELSVPGSDADCELFQCFNELVTILQIYASKYNFPVEMETSTFIPNTQDEVWRPWHHVYSCCKAGKGQIHKPVYNPFGKYVLRLFYMGSWRKFVIDDLIPCDNSDLCLLPVTQIQGELWPILLVKGLLKITSLTDSVSLIDFPLLTLFTGWIDQKVTIGDKTKDQIWRRLFCLTPQYEYENEEQEAKIPPPVPPSVKGSSKIASSKGPDKVEPPTKQFCFVLATLEGFAKEDNLLYSHRIGITMSRDVPLVKCNKREATQAWKRIRWVYWALERGIWTDERRLPPYRRARYITHVKELNRLLAPDAENEAKYFQVSDVEETGLQVQSEVSTYEMEDWLDFCQMHKYLLSLNVLFKPSCLRSSFMVTCLSSNVLLKTSESSGARKTAPKAAAAAPPPPQQTAFFQPITMLPTQNEPCLLLCESTSGITLIMSLWVYPPPTSKFFGYLDSEQPELFKVGQASLVIEHFDWRAVEQGEILGIIKTVGNSSVWLNLRPGRHVLRLWLRANFPYVLKIHSNVEVVVHKSPKTRFLMTTETERILEYIGNVSNAFIALSQKFGKPDLPLALSEFYAAIKPKNDKDPNYRRKMDDFIETFLLSILLTLKSLASNTDELRIMKEVLQSLFINPKIFCDLPKEPSLSLYADSAKKGSKKVFVLPERTLSQILSYPWSPEELKLITTIQRIFRGYRVRLLWKRQSPTRKEFKLFTEKLKKISDVLFSPAKREFEVGKLIRLVVMTNPGLRTMFKFHEDFSKVIQVEEYTGRIGVVEPFAWIPFVRFIVACHSAEPVPYAFYVSANLEHFVVVGVNNDTNEEIFRLTNSVMPHYYQSNVRGYTILVYGWNEANPKTVNWRLQMVKMRHFHVIHLCNTMLGLPCQPYSIPALDALEIKNFYIPNHKSRVCRCFIKVQKRTLLSVRLSTSYSDVRFFVTIYLNRKFDFSEGPNFPKIVATANSAEGSVLLPSVVLEYVEPIHWWGEANPEDEPTVYILEAFVIKNSWPLTKREWGMVEPFRVNGESWKDSVTSLTLKKGPSESRRKMTRTSKRSLNEQKVVENPFWFLQVLSDSAEGADSGDHVVVEEDKTYAESVKAMKISWEEKNPGRRKKGREIRYNFLNEMFLEELKKREDEEEEERGGEDVEERKDFYSAERGSASTNELQRDGNFKTLLELMSNFSYLTHDKSSVRYSQSPRVLPKVPFTEMLYNYKVYKATKADDTLTYEGSIINPPVCLKRVVEEVRVVTLTRQTTKIFFNETNYYRNVLANHLAEEQKLSTQLMEEAYEGRLKAIERQMR